MCKQRQNGILAAALFPVGLTKRETNMTTETIPYEMTDTFAGEANYSWVRRGAVQIRKRGKWGESFSNYERRIVRAVKAELGLTGVRCQRVSYGEQIVLRPVGCCHIVFIC